MTALELRDVSKTFADTRVLNSVGFQVAPGEVVALLGENGSGKSTLVKILSGYHAPDSGAQLTIAGKVVRFPLRPGESRHHGMSFVFQDLGLVPELSVLENLGINRHVGARGRRRARVSWSHERRWAEDVLSHYAIDVDCSTLVKDLLPVERALVAIVRSIEELRSYRELTGGAGSVLVLDEPTVFLPDQETRRLYELVGRVASEGTAVIFISHDLDAVRAIASRVLVLRDGCIVGDVKVGQTSDRELVELIVGHGIDELDRTSTTSPTPDESTRRAASRPRAPVEKVSLVARGLRGGAIRKASFELRQHEVLGITGLVGSGAESIPYLLVGALGGEVGGELTIGRSIIPIRDLSPRGAVALDIGLVPADRQQDGLASSISVGENMLLLVLDDYYRHGRLDRKALRSRARERCRELAVRPSEPEARVELLSGGNQQKVVLAKWFEIQPRVLILHEPTQGVDVGVREEIYRLLRRSTEAGSSVLMVSTDLAELARIADRVLVMRSGHVVGEYSGDKLSKQALSHAVYAPLDEASVAASSS